MMPMHAVEKVTGLAMPLLKHFEGFSPTPYMCPANVLTIGYGHVITSRESFTEISESDASQLLGEDFQHFLWGVERLTKVPLDMHQWAALGCFAYNVGLGAYQRSTLRQKVKRQEHAEVPEQFLRWIWGGGKRLPGLLRRRQVEALLYSHALNAYQS